MSGPRKPYRGDSDERDETISRREFVQRVALVSAVSGVTLAPAVVASVDARDSASEPTGNRDAVLSRLLDHLIPAHEGLPAAGALGIASFIERARSLAPHVHAHVALVLASLPESEIVARWSESEWDACVSDIARRHASAFDLFLQAAYTGYYSHPDVLAALEWRDPAEMIADGGGGWFDETLLRTVSRTHFPPA